MCIIRMYNWYRLMEFCIDSVACRYYVFKDNKYWKILNVSENILNLYCTSNLQSIKTNLWMICQNGWATTYYLKPHQHTSPRLGRLRDLSAGLRLSPRQKPPWPPSLAYGWRVPLVCDACRAVGQSEPCSPTRPALFWCSEPKNNKINLVLI